jgi:hypothetical protein
VHTLLPQVHLHLQRLEVVRDIRLDLLAHALVGPLLEAIELLVHIHPVYILLSQSGYPEMMLSRCVSEVLAH